MIVDIRILKVKYMCGLGFKLQILLQPDPPVRESLTEHEILLPLRV